MDTGSVKVSDLKARLQRLGLEMPTTINEKPDLIRFVEEAEKQYAGSPAAAHPPSPAAPHSRSGDVEVLPHPWYKKESRSKPGNFYYVNADTGQTSWKRPEETGEHRAPLPDPRPAPAPAAKSSKRFSLGRKHDYRDDAFVQEDPEPLDAAGTSAPEDDVDPLEQSWSRDGSMTCERSTGGVKALDLKVSSTESKVSDSTVIGETFKWVRGEIIGRGALGRVFKALDQTTGEVIAVKEVLLNISDEEDNKFLKDLKNEVDILKNLKHDHIVSYRGHDYIDGCLFMYMEHMSGGTVTQALQQFGVFEEVLIADYAQQVLRGLKYLHESDPPVVHRDIKGSNILLGLDCKAKLADFGCSRRTNQTLTHTMRGSVPWMAPEVIAFSRFGRSADIWSFGCFIIEMGTATVPWGRFDNQMAALLKIGMSKELPKLPEDVSDLCKAFIFRCLKRNAEERPSASELLDDELFKVAVKDV